MTEMVRNNVQSDVAADEAAIDASSSTSSSSEKMYKMIGESIGKRAAAKSCGLFRADDWQCGKCRNVNWARRSLCNVCNAPKFVEIEQRTGVGGGYNEREEAVEYVRRKTVESDDEEEYDEYGRRKRKKWKRDGKGEEDFVEDESEDEGVDLSKYDLCNLEDDDEGAENSNESAKQ